MGKPAARLGDMTAHGGAIVLGFPTVLIGGMPAARIGDMHVCPMMTPGVPPIPHVGGPVTLGSPTVLIGNMPAARMGDMLVCVGPPDTIVLGCPTVLIGEAGSGSASGGGGGGGGGGGAGGGGAASAGSDTTSLLSEVAEAWKTTVEVWQQGTATAVAAAKAGAALATGGSKEVKTQKGHWIEFACVDSAGLPVGGVPYRFTAPDGTVTESTLAGDGRIRRDGLTAGQGKIELLGISNARWSKAKAGVGESVSMQADVEGFPAGTPATYRVFVRDIDGPDRPVAEIAATTQGTSLTGSWAFAYPEEGAQLEGDAADGYSAPQFYFEVSVASARSRSALLTIEDVIEIKLLNAEGQPAANEPYVVVFSNGAVRKGKLDRNGCARETGVSIAHWSIIFPEQSGDVALYNKPKG